MTEEKFIVAFVVTMFLLILIFVLTDMFRDRRDVRRGLMQHLMLRAAPIMEEEDPKDRVFYAENGASSEEAEEEKAKKAADEEGDTPPAPQAFEAEYRLGNISLCAAKSGQDGVFHIFSRIGESGSPVYETKVFAANAAEALAVAADRLGLKI